MRLKEIIQEIIELQAQERKQNQGQKTNKVNTKERTLQEITQDLKNAKMQKENVNVPKTEKSS